MDGDLAARHGLHLAQPPIGLSWMAHEDAGFEEGIETAHCRVV